MYYDDSNTRAKNRKKIVDVTKDLFFEKGITKSTVMDIVKKASLERKTFYNYFMDKDEIADYIYVLTMDEIFEYDREISRYDHYETGYQKIEDLLHSMVDIFSDHHIDFFYLIRHDYLYNKKLNDSEYGFAYNDRFMSHIRMFINEGIIDQSIEITPLEVDELISTFLKSVVSFYSTKLFESYKHNKLKDIEFDSVRALLNLLLKSIKKGKTH